MNKISLKPQSILIVKTSSLGDVIHTFPAVHFLRRLFPDAKIDWLVNTALIPVVRTHPDVDTVIPYPRKEFSSFWKFLPTLIDLVETIREKNYDAVIDFQGLIRTSFFVGLSGSARRIGFSHPREGVSRYAYNEKIDVPAMHAVLRNLELVKRAFESEGELIWPPLRTNEGVEEIISAILPVVSPNIKTVGIVPGARWESKKWPRSFFTAVMTAVNAFRPNIRFVVIGGPDEIEDAAALCAETPECTIINAVGKTDTAGLMELIRRCDAVVSSDTGPLHIAVAQNVPVFALFGPNDPEYSGPCGKGHHVYKSALDCSPCMKRICPIERTAPPCHLSLNSEKIASEIIQQWE